MGRCVVGRRAPECAVSIDSVCLSTSAVSDPTTTHCCFNSGNFVLHMHEECITSCCNRAHSKGHGTVVGVLLLVYANIGPNKRRSSADGCTGSSRAGPVQYTRHAIHIEACICTCQCTQCMWLVQYTHCVRTRYRTTGKALSDNCMQLSGPPAMLSGAVASNCVRNPGGRAERNP